jgi:hypothetical protein
MGMTTPVRLTKPRVSLMILEGTATVVSVVLVVWLLFWFLGKTYQREPVAAYYVAARDGLAEEVPFQAADVALLTGTEDSTKVSETRPDRLVPEIRKKLASSGQPLIIFVSAPVTKYGKDDVGRAIQDLIELLATSAKRNVLLALDLAQVDTDRDLGIFGNSPYSGIEQSIHERAGNPGSSICVITSAAPAQKSWSADGLGHSIFAHALHEGLKGKATGWDDQNPSAITVKGLYRYVSRNVQAWARSQRASVQTPVLLPVSSNDRKWIDFELRKMPRPIPTEGTAKYEAPEPDVRSKSVSVNPPENHPDPPTETKPAIASSPVDELLAEWKEYQQLTEKRPYRHVPGAWRSYEAALLRAERSLRAATHDPTLWTGQARAALKTVESKKANLTTQWQARKDDELKFPFQAVRNDPKGKVELAAALRYLQVQLPPWLGAARPQINDAEAGADNAKARVDENKGAPEARLPFPAYFAGPATEPPLPFLELQLPKWAYKFTQEFKCPRYFIDSPQQDLFVRLVELRCNAEEALAMDRRGLSWIKRLIEGGDRDRRLTQDRLFGMRQSGQQTDGEPPLTTDQPEHAYKKALDAIARFHDAREAWEEAAATFPYYAEWAIRIEAANQAVNALGSAGGGPAFARERPLPPPVNKGLVALDKLAQALHPPTARDEGEDSIPAETITAGVERIGRESKELREALSGIRAEFERSINSLRTQRTPEWIELDAALRVPFVSPDTRKDLLEKIRNLEDRYPEIVADNAKEGDTETPQPPDRGFWIRAAALAELDCTLRGLGLGSPNSENSPRSRIAMAWTELRRGPDDPEIARQDLFQPINALVTQHRRQTQNLLPKRNEGDATGELSDVEKSLRDTESLVRHLTATEADELISMIDRSVGDYDRLAECDALAFHIRRLKRDYVPDADLHRLEVDLAQRQKALRINPSAAAPASVGSLKLAVKPDLSISIDKAWKAEFALIVGTLQDRAMPSGSAFVGVTGIVTGLTVNDIPPGDDIPGNWVKIGSDALESQTVIFRVEQKGSVTPQAGYDTINLDVRLFYRGRTDLAKPIKIGVKPDNRKERLAIRISQNQKKLAEKYPNAGPIPDQFVGHQDEGVVHKGKSLDYIVTIENLTPVPLAVKYRLGMVEPAVQELGLDWTEMNRLRPGQPIEIRGEWKASELSHLRKPRLIVEVKEEGSSEQPRRLKVDFREISWSQYMDPDARRIVRFETAPGGPFEDCFVVKMTRRAEDRVTEPIPIEELKCDFTTANPNEGGTATVTQPGRDWLWPNEPVNFFQPLKNLKMPIKIKWSAQIEMDRTDPKEWSP